MEKRKVVARAFGKVLRAQRVNAKLSQQMLSVRAGLSPQYINSLEAGRHVPSMVTFVKLAIALGMQVDSLMLFLEEELKNSNGGR